MTLQNPPPHPQKLFQNTAQKQQLPAAADRQSARPDRQTGWSHSLLRTAGVLPLPLLLLPSCCGCITDTKPLLCRRSSRCGPMSCSFVHPVSAMASSNSRRSMSSTCCTPAAPPTASPYSTGRPNSTAEAPSARACKHTTAARGCVHGGARRREPTTWVLVQTKHPHLEDICTPPDATIHPHGHSALHSCNYGWQHVQS